MINVQEIRRNVINVVRNYSDAQVKVRKATSNEPWGPSATLMSEIADLTYNVVAFSEIMQIIWKRLNDHGKNWRHVYKALVVLEYLIKTGSEKVAQQCRDNLFAIQTLKDFQYFEENKDQGLSIREKSKLLVNLLKDEERLKVERSRALKAKERFSQSLSYMGDGQSSSNDPTFKSSSSYPESLSQSDSAAAAAAARSELEQARPQTAGEEKLQLELALAMSKEEAEQEERLRQNDDLRLKLALKESEKNKSNNSDSTTSAVDELLSLNSAGPSTSGGGIKTISNDPWSPVAGVSSNSLSSNPVASLLPSPPLNNKSKHNQQINNQIKLNNNDPWSTGTTGTILNDFDQQPNNKPSSSFDDPWSSASASTSLPNNDPWSLNGNDTIANNDPWNPSAGSSLDAKNKEFRALSEPVKILDQQSSAQAATTIQNRRTPEGFLGPNSNLVNLDALVSSSKTVQTSTTSPNNNPFASAMTPVVNPFQANKPSQPTINELRAQTNNMMSGMITSSSSNISATNTGGVVGSSSMNNSIFNISPINPVTSSNNTTSIYPQLPTTSPIINNNNNNANSSNSVWGNFPTTTQQQSAFSSTSLLSPQSNNNPFAM